MNGTMVWPATDPEETRRWLNDLSREQFAKLIAFFESTPRMQKEVSYDCDECGGTTTVTLRGLSDFFS